MSKLQLPCPQCGSPLRVMLQIDTPSHCDNCGFDERTEQVEDDLLLPELDEELEMF